MTVAEAVETKDFGKVADTVYGIVSQNGTISDEDKALINAHIHDYDDTSIDVVNAKANKFMNLNILESNFAVFDGLSLWGIIYYSSMNQITPVLAREAVPEDGE